jgi:hypothetical protein
MLGTGAARSAATESAPSNTAFSVLGVNVARDVQTSRIIALSPPYIRSLLAPTRERSWVTVVDRLLLPPPAPPLLPPALSSSPASDSCARISVTLYTRIAFVSDVPVMEWAPSRRADVASKGQLGN